MLIYLSYLFNQELQNDVHLLRASISFIFIRFVDIAISRSFLFDRSLRFN